MMAEGANWENALITNIIQEKSMKEVIGQKISVDFFYGTIERAAFIWLLEWYKNPDVGDTPSWEIFMDEWPNFEAEVVEDSCAALCKKVREVKLYSDLAEAITHIGEVTQGNAFEGLDELKQMTARLGSLHTIDSAVDVRDRLEEIKQEYMLMKTGKTGLKGKPYPWQTLNDATLGCQDQHVVVIYGRPKTYKAQPMNEPVLTPTGWRTMRRLKVGDEVIGSSGKAVRVTGVYPQGKKEVFRVVMSDGSSTRCCDEHLWFTRKRREATGSVRTLAEIRQTINRDHRIPVMEAVHFRPTKTMPLDPYLLGALLGDGCLTRSTEITFCKPEEDVLSAVIEKLPEGDDVSFNYSANRAVYLRIVGGGECSQTSQILEQLELVGVYSHEKFIPSIYKLASVGERADLLAGLLDTDGHVPLHGAGVVFSSASERLRNDVVWVARSLGAIVTTQEYDSYYKQNDQAVPARKAYRARIRFPNNYCPVRSEKHTARWKDNPRPIYRTIKSVEPAGVEECVCIAVDAPDQLYVTRDFIVTHNTWMALAVMRGFHQAGSKVLICSQELGDLEMARRVVALDSGVDYRQFLRGELPEEIEADFMQDLEAFAEQEPVIIDQLLQMGSEIDIELSQKIDEIGVDSVLVDGAHTLGRDWKELGQLTRTLKRVAKKKNVRIVVTTHAHRRGGKVEVGGAADDIAHSDSFFQDCDLALRLQCDIEHRRAREVAAWTAAIRDGESCGFVVNMMLAEDLTEKKRLKLGGEDDVEGEIDQADLDGEEDERE